MEQEQQEPVADPGGGDAEERAASAARPRRQLPTLAGSIIRPTAPRASSRRRWYASGARAS